nr:universal stress protein [Spirulina major]
MNFRTLKQDWLANIPADLLAGMVVALALIPEAIAQYAENNNIDLLMMGAYGHKRIRYLVIGSTTTQILRRINLPVLLFR